MAYLIVCILPLPGDEIENRTSDRAAIILFRLTKKLLGFNFKKSGGLTGNSLIRAPPEDSISLDRDLFSFGVIGDSHGRIATVLHFLPRETL